MMDKEQLKKLAEWFNPRIQKDSYGFYEEAQRIDWQPDKDSNQLDMLEDKMIKERKVYEIVIDFHKTQQHKAIYCNSIENIIGFGDTKNEARLNAILNYIRSK